MHYPLSTKKLLDKNHFYAINLSLALTENLSREITLLMTNEEYTKILEKIHALGFKPFTYPNPQDFDLNPGRIDPPVEFQADDWLSINQCEVIAKKSDRTIYRWQTIAGFINFTILAEGKDRNNVRHYIWKNDFLSYMQDILKEKVVYVYQNPLTQQTEGISDKSTEGRVKPLTPDMSIRHMRQEVIDLDPETKAKMLALPDELSNRLLNAFTQALSKQKEELVKELSKFDQFFTKQLEYKEKGEKETAAINQSVSTLSKSLSKSTWLISILIALLSMSFAGVMAWQTHRTKLEREDVEKRLSADYAQKLETVQNSLTKEFQNLASSLALVKENLNIKEQPKDSPESEPIKENR